jgi:hypothetical protein
MTTGSGRVRAGKWGDRLPGAKYWHRGGYPTIWSYVIDPDGINLHCALTETVRCGLRRELEPPMRAQLRGRGRPSCAAPVQLHPKCFPASWRV